MNLKLFCSVFLFNVVTQPYWASGQVCYQTQMVPTSCGETSASPHVPAQGQQGPPGKRGPIGPVGYPGPQGLKGDVGEGVEEFSAIFERKLEKIQEQLFKMRKIARGECLGGMKSGQITDDQLSASGFYNEQQDKSKNNIHHYTNARLDEARHAWAPKTQDLSDFQWIQIDFRNQRTVQGIVLQGRYDYSQWVTSFKVMYGQNENSLDYITEDGVEKVFQGTTDRHSHKQVIFTEEIQARFLRIVPITWTSYPSLRFDIVSC